MRQNIIIILDRKSTRLNSSHDQISYAVFCLKKKKNKKLNNNYIELFINIYRIDITYLSFYFYFFFFLIYLPLLLFSFFFFNDTATTEIYTLSLHDALPILTACSCLFFSFRRHIFVRQI